MIALQSVSKHFQHRGKPVTALDKVTPATPPRATACTGWSTSTPVSAGSSSPAAAWKR